MRSTALLLLGYSRPEFVARRINELQLLNKKELDFYVSLDAYDGPNVSSVCKKFNQLREKHTNIHWLLAEKRFGLTIHLFTRVSELLQEYQRVIVIEDDISTSVQGIRELMRTESLFESKEFFTQGLFGALPKTSVELFMKNRWRKTIYFSAWGWAINRNLWSLYDYQIVRKVGLQALTKNSNWVNLSPNQKRRWTHRFSRVEADPLFTWDYQMQFLSWLHKLDHILPLWRLCDNEGFADERASNTKAPKPNWYLGKKSTRESSLRLMGKNNPTRLLDLLDSYTWIGDRKLSDLIKSKYINKI